MSTIRSRIEAMKRQKLVMKKVVNLSDYRSLKKPVKTKNILVVDDDPIILSALKRVLEVKGYRVVVALDGVELSHKLESARFHMFIIDINLPWVDGYELCKLIKSFPHYCDLPLILISSLSKKEDIDRGYQCGCDEYLIKPFDMNYIVGTVEKALSS
ncbi:MAG: response regulator [Proteobacteria bacterium]|nr:response regulator [Pseudomonadota bacterium]